MTYIFWSKHRESKQIDLNVLERIEPMVMNYVRYSETPPTIVEISMAIDVDTKYVSKAIRQLRKDRLIGDTGSKPVKYRVLNLDNLSLF